ncbi:homoserine dehydrogenase [Synechococcus sp. PCC 7336]|uniref:homoserine dehydrogenase n=1 Tax=Synechococcus sp. PCC 7336 TaxID=195250 RepID=UPI00034B7B93|nr:homoserine dehydrogenase [Synechococcus sp. PCC 7336]
MVYRLGLLGLGTVGTGVAQILQSPSYRHPLLKELSIARVGVRSLDKPRDIDLPNELLTNNLSEIVSDREIDIAIELIGGIEPARSLILQAIANGKHVVTANKAVIAAHGKEIFTAAERTGACVLLEAAVGGGIPILQPLQQCLGANVIHRITGIANGTTNFILDRMTQTGQAFADALATAQALGYAEADPTADVDGLDAADKIAILAGIAFNERVDRADVFCEGIRHITDTDIRYSREWGFEVKLLATAERDLETREIDLRVHPMLLPFEHPLANVHLANNAILVQGEPIGEVMFFGPGAGRGPTASAVVSDILNIVAKLEAGIARPDRYFNSNTLHEARVRSIERVTQRYYARVLAKDRPGVIGAMGQCFGDRNVSLERVVQKDVLGGAAEVVVLTHNVLERNFQQALNDIRQLPAIQSVETVLRVLPD